MASNQTNEATATRQSISKPRGLTLEDAFICIDKTTWLESRAYMSADARDAALMARLTQWRGSSLQHTTPVAKQIAGWDFLGART